MNAMRAAVLPEPRMGQGREADAQDGMRDRPDLRLVHRADLAAAAPMVAAPRAAAPRVAVPVLTVPAVTLTPPARPRPADRRSRPGHPASPLRLTRRGRIVVATMAVLLLATLSLIAAGAAQAISHAGAAHPAGSHLAQVVVQPGQSLWAVAESADPNADTRLVIQQITELNSLDGETVFAGQRLWVPRG